MLTLHVEMPWWLAAGFVLVAVCDLLLRRYPIKRKDTDA